jgi:hypothetical protein
VSTHRERTAAQVLLDRFSESGIGYGDTILSSTINEWQTQAGNEWPGSEELDGKGAAEVRRTIEAMSLRRMGAWSMFSDKLLEDRKMCLHSIGSGNYLVIKPSDQTAITLAKGMDRVRRELTKMARRLEHTNHTELTSEQRAENAAGKARVGALKQSMTSRRHNVTRLLPNSKKDKKHGDES